MSDTTLYEIPFVTSGSWFAQPVNINGTDYVLEFQFNERANRWYMDILDAAEAPIVQGIALTCGRDLLRAYRSRVMSDIVMFVSDTTGNGNDPMYDSFMLTHKLLFGVLS